MPLSWTRGANLDAAVDKAYEACGGKTTYRNDAERVAFLFDLYQRQTGFPAAAQGKRNRKTPNQGDAL